MMTPNADSKKYPTERMKLMTGSKKKILPRLLAVFMLLPALTVTAFAGSPNSEAFRIDVDLNVPDSKDVYDTQIYLYQVADAQVDGNGNLHMEPVGLFQDLTFDGLRQENVRGLTDVLCERIQYSGTGNTGNLAPVAVQKPGKDGMIRFDNLDAGVYLLRKWSCEDPERLEMLPALVYLPTYHQASDRWEHTARVIPKFSWQTDPVPPPTTPDSKLPQTGMVQWPIPVLAVAGMFLLVIGYGMIRRSKED